MGTTIGEVNINLRMSLAQFRQDTQKGTQDASRATKQMSDEMRAQTGEAKASLALLGEEFGIKIPRHIRGFISALPGVGTALTAAFNSVAVLALIGVLVELGSKLYETAEKADAAYKKIQEATAATLAETKKLIEANYQATLSPVDLALRKIALTKNEAQQAEREIERLNEKIKDMLSQTYRVGTGQGTSEEKHLYDEQSADIKALESQRDALGKKVDAFYSTQKKDTLELAKAEKTVAAEAQAALDKRIAAQLRLNAEQFKSYQAARAALENMKPETPYADRVIGDDKELQSKRVGPTFDSTFSDQIKKQNEEVLKDAARVYDLTRTSAEKYTETMNQLNQMLSVGVIDQETYNRAVAEAKLKHDEVAAAFRDLGTEIGNTIKQGRLFGASWKESLESIAISVTQLILKMTLLKNLSAVGAAGGGGGIGGFFSSLLGGLFGGGKARGGDVSPGHYYEWQENGREYFAPTVPGVVIPAAAMASKGERPINQTININGVVDMDSFKRSQSQIAADMARLSTGALRRNG